MENTYGPKGENKMREAVFIDFSNKEQVEWFIKRGAKLVKWIPLDSIVETATGKVIGRLYLPRGLFAKKAIKEATSFMKNMVTVTSSELQRYKK